MTGNVRQTPPEPTCGTLWVTCDNSPTFDGTGPQNAPEGTVDMNSIDNLREWWRDRFPVMDRQLGCDFREHINAIECEVKALIDERDLLKLQWEAGVDFDQRLESCADKRADVTLFGVDYTALPLDADGVPIHVGDWITGDWDAKAKVVAITSEDVYWWEPDGCHWCHAYEVRHHHTPTVEDVLEEFVARWMETHHDDIPALKAEYAARLRLAGDE